MTAAVFLDRDGVINQGVMDEEVGAFESPYRADDVVLEDRAVEGLRVLEGLGVPLIVASNQPAAAKGRVSLAELWEVHERVIALLGEEGIALTDWRYCFHHPTGTVPQLSGPCPCRKPQAGLLRAAAERHGIDLERSWMIGDTDRDVGAGKAAGRAPSCWRTRARRTSAAARRARRSWRRDLAAAAAIVVAEAGKGAGRSRPGRLPAWRRTEPRRRHPLHGGRRGVDRVNHLGSPCQPSGGSRLPRAESARMARRLTRAAANRACPAACRGRSSDVWGENR